jgi:flagellar biosynthesis/type III secretory pathway protein FliH
VEATILSDSAPPAADDWRQDATLRQGPIGQDKPFSPFWVTTAAPAGFTVDLPLDASAGNSALEGTLPDGAGVHAKDTAGADRDGGGGALSHPGAAGAATDHAGDAALAGPDPAVLAREREAGFEAGRAAARAELRTEMETQRRELAALIASAEQAVADPRQFFAPMERLAVHLAEQLVRGELSLSGRAIRRLVENSLMELDQRALKVRVKLHPADMDKFCALPGELGESIELVRDPALGRGSVKIEMTDGAIDDLIEHRLDAICASLLGEGAELRSPRPRGRESTFEPAKVVADLDGVLSHDFDKSGRGADLHDGATAFDADVDPDVDAALDGDGGSYAHGLGQRGGFVA